MSEIWQLSATNIASAVRSKQLSATEVTNAHLERLNRVNSMINAVVQEFPEEALAAAKIVDNKISNNQEPGPLCGVPVTIKVNVDQIGHATTNGLVIQKDLIAQTDSPVVSNLKKSGAIIVGRTNTPAFSLRWFTKNNLHGHTLNPRNRLITPGGSSGGAAAAVASGICAIGHGTDIGGSIRYPAYACGLHGLRPTLGRVAAYNASGSERHIGGQVMAVSGPITRTIDDCRIALDAMSAQDLRDPWWAPVPIEQGEFPKRAALCVAPEGLHVDEEIKKALHEAASSLQKQGWEIEEIETPSFRNAADINAKLWMAEMRFAAAAMVAKEGETDSSFVFQQMITRSETIDINGFQEALQKRAALIREWQLFLEKYPILICPVSGELPFQDQQDVRSSEDFEAIMEAQLTQLAVPALGLPGLAVATGYVGKTPIGIQLIAGRYREDILLNAGKLIESATKQRGPVDPQ